MLLIGLDNAGKTTVVKRLAGEDIGKVSPTLGFSIKSLSFRDYRINIWDIGAREDDHERRPRRPPRAARRAPAARSADSARTAASGPPRSREDGRR